MRKQGAIPFVRRQPMRMFGSLVEKGAKFREPTIPGQRLERVNPSLVNYLDEGVRELFNYACAANELDDAADLLALARTWHARRAYADELQSRTGEIFVERMAGELKRRHIMRGTARPPA
jgi:hypothetical protein